MKSCKPSASPIAIDSTQTTGKTLTSEQIFHIHICIHEYGIFRVAQDPTSCHLQLDTISDTTIWQRAEV